MSDAWRCYDCHKEMGAFVPVCHACAKQRGGRTVREIADAMRKLGITGDTLFDRIRDDIERGQISSARSHLNFVDRMLAEANDRFHGQEGIAAE